MKAAIYSEFRGPITIEEVDDPSCDPESVIIEVKASGLCLSDWHGWQGHDADITLPHVPGHELAGTVVEIGREVKWFKPGDRVTVPFVCGCGTCPQCESGNHQICDHQTQPGFTHWGSFAQYVSIRHADLNLVSLPQEMDFVTAASLGCRFATSFRAVKSQGAVKPGDWVVVWGCGGVGLSAIMIAKSLGAMVIAVDIKEEQLEMARNCGADYALNSSLGALSEKIKNLSDGGANQSFDALGSQEIVTESLRSLRKRGRHIQVGLLPDGDVSIPGDLLIAREIEIVGSHGMQAFRYQEMLKMIQLRQLNPSLLISELISLEDVPKCLPEMDNFNSPGIKVITDFLA